MDRIALLILLVFMIGVSCKSIDETPADFDAKSISCELTIQNPRVKVGEKIICQIKIKSKKYNKRIYQRFISVSKNDDGYLYHSKPIYKSPELDPMTIDINSDNILTHEIETLNPGKTILCYEISNSRFSSSYKIQIIKSNIVAIEVK